MKFRGTMSVGLLILWCASAHATTECTGNIVRLWTGDSGSVYGALDNGLTWVTTASDPNTKNILASAISAFIAGRSVTVRVTAAISCDSSGGTRSDVVGMWLNAS